MQSIMSRKVLTLGLIRKLDQVLLGHKKRGFGVNKWNGFGGKVEEKESICEAAARELREESGLVVLPVNLEKIAVIDFEFSGDPVILEVHVFTSTKYEGQPFETEGKYLTLSMSRKKVAHFSPKEMLPKWFHVLDIPFDDMWADDKLWFPLFLSGKKFKGYFLFKGHDVILKHNLEIVSHF